MLTRIYFCKYEKHKRYVEEKTVIRNDSVRLAGINIISDDSITGGLDSNIKPCLQLQFNLSDPLRALGMPPATNNAMAHQRHKKRFDELRKRTPGLPTDRAAEKIIVFCNELFKDTNPWELWIVCPDGRRSSASVARFLQALNIEVPVEGLDCINTDWHNIYLSSLIGYNYGKMLKRNIIEAKKNEPDATIKPTVRGEENQT